MSNWHGCCNTTSRENEVLRQPALQRPRRDFGYRRGRERECGYSFALSIAPDSPLSRQLYYDRQQFDQCLAKGRYPDTLALIFLYAGERCACLRPRTQTEVCVPFTLLQPAS
jgi:hypothetical protein